MSLLPLMVLPPLPVVVPLAVAGLLLASSTLLPRYVPDAIALLTALFCLLVCGAMVEPATAHPLVYWFGGWAPHDGRPLGIGFVVDPVGALIGAFTALLFTATLIFAWGFFDKVHAHFHVLMLLFMAAMIGFCLTHDLFNLFVWFEVMSVSAFALTAYALRSSALDGALNFTVVNTIGSYLILAGIGLLYLQLGTLDLGMLQAGVAASPGQPAIYAAFALLCVGLLTKGAQVPFQFWLADAHSVAPSPVSVIFSGIMVSIGLFGILRLTTTIFLPDPQVQHVLHGLLPVLGGASAVVGGAMAIFQRHLKRMLAFSTVAHCGILLMAISLPGRLGPGAMLLYLLGHGLAKGAMFMVAGIVLAACGDIDELRLRGRGRPAWPAGLAMAAGGLLLAGLPLGLMDAGMSILLEQAHEAAQHWPLLVAGFAAATTGGAILRAAGRIFLGLGSEAAEEEQGPTEEEREPADRPLWLMMLPTTLLLLLACMPGAWILRLVMPDDEPAASATSWTSWSSLGAALVIAGWELSLARLPAGLKRTASVLLAPTALLRRWHSGLVGDYVTWMCLGLALFALAFTV